MAIVRTLTGLTRNELCAIPAKPIGYSSQIKKRSNATHKPTLQLLHILICPAAQQPQYSFQPL